MADDEKPDERPPEFDDFENLTRDLLKVSKSDLDRARATEPPDAAPDESRREQVE